jgi:hypothetical protein
VVARGRVGGRIRCQIALRSDNRLSGAFPQARGEDDEDSVSLVDAMTILAEKWTEGFHATDVAVLINDSFNQDALALREFLYPGSPSGLVVAARSVGKRPAAHIDEPVKSGGCTLILRKKEETTDRKAKGALKYFVHTDPAPKT